MSADVGFGGTVVVTVTISETSIVEVTIFGCIEVGRFEVGVVFGEVLGVLVVILEEEEEEEEEEGVRVEDNEDEDDLDVVAETAANCTRSGVVGNEIREANMVLSGAVVDEGVLEVVGTGEVVGAT